MNDFVKNMSVILPSYRPDEKLFAVLEGLTQKGFTDIIVVNDGSGSDFHRFFERAAALTNVTVLTHPENCGKGRALKTAFTYCMENRPSCTGVVTVDGDNQHHPDDILACCQRLAENPGQVVLGARSIDAGEVPLRSRLGNTLTRNVFRFACGIRITDTQTGLRAIPAEYLSLMTGIPGERYEYETNMLLEMKSHEIPFTEVKIRTIYLDDNASSHFHPLRDSLRIYRTILAFLASSLISSLLDMTLFLLLISILDRSWPEGLWNIAIATTAARIFSSLCNYLINCKRVFRSKNRHSLASYYLLCVLQLSVSAGLVSLFAALLSAGDIGKTLIKAVVDTLLFLVSYQLQREWVFRKK